MRGRLTDQTSPLPTRAGDGRGFLRRGRNFLFGNERHLGLWVLPLFLIMGLLGATLAGGLAMLYYGQQVRDLERSTTRVLSQLEERGEELLNTADDAQKAIEDQARQVRDAVAQAPPVSSPNDAGIYAVAARHASGEIRVGSAFTIFSDGAETFLVTSYGLVQTADGFSVTSALVYLPNDTVTAVVHNYDRDLDVATLRLRGGPLPVPQWRPGNEEVRRGDVVYAAGIAGPGTPAVVQGIVAGVSNQAVVPDLNANSFLAGGPLLDGSGRVIAVTSMEYRPFGPADGSLRYSVPIRAICRRLVRCTRADLSAGELGDEGGSGAIRRAPTTEPSPSPTPSPTSSPTPSPRPTFSPEPTATP